LHSLSEILPQPSIKTVTKCRDRLFFDQYRYCLSFKLAHLYAARGLTHAQLDFNQSRRNFWLSSIAGTKAADIITAHDTARLHEFIDRCAELGSQRRIHISNHWAFVYHDNKNSLLALAQWDALSDRQLSEVKITRARDTVFKPNSPWRYRTYFNERSYHGRTQHQPEQIARCLQGQDWSCSNSLRKRLKESRARDYKTLLVFRYHFIEHNDLKNLMILAMKAPGLIRKTCDIIVAK